MSFKNLSKVTMLQEIRKLLADAVQGTEFEGKVYFAGGCVRDELLGRPCTDIDVTVNLPDGGIRLADYLYQKGIASKPVIYKQFGTALVKVDGYKIELVMTRKESYRGHSRKPEVEFGSLEEDVLRRDFTVNSLLMNVSDGEIIDLSRKGLSDLRHRVIRATSNPDIIFTEDPLRLLRAVRFALELDFELEKKTRLAMRKQASALRHISRERVLSELMLIIKHPNFLRGIFLLNKTGLRSVIFPGLRLPAAFFRAGLIKQLDSEKLHSELVKLNWRCRLALVLYASRNCGIFLSSLKLPQKDSRAIKQLVDTARDIRCQINRGLLTTSGQILKLAFQLGELLPEFLQLYPLIGVFYEKDRNTLQQDLAFCRKLKKIASELNSYRFNLTGDDLMRTFSLKGAEIGYYLDAAQDYWYEHPLAEKDELLQYIQNMIELKRKSIK